MNTKQTVIGKIVDAVGDSLPADFDAPHLGALLIRAAAEEVQAWYQYIAPAKFAVGRERPSIVRTFIETAHDELHDHFDRLMERLAQLEVDVTALTDLWNLRALSDVFIPTHYPYTVEQLLEAAIRSEEAAIRTYKEIMDFCKDKDAVTFELARHILADEEEHLTNFVDFQNDLAH